METIIRSVGDASTGEEYWSNSMPFTWGPQLTQWHWQQWQILSLIFLVDGDKTYQGMRIVLGRLSRGKGSVRSPKALFLSHC